MTLHFWKPIIAEYFVQKWGFLLGGAGFILLIDQLSKQWIINKLEVGDSLQPISALHPYFQITRSYNTGAAFGILPDAGIFFLIMAVLVVIALVYYVYPRVPANAYVTQLGIALVMGGALGNIADRLQHDFVVDFIHYQIPNLVSNISNIADHAIIFGVIVLLLDSWRHEENVDSTEAIEQLSYESTDTHSYGTSQGEIE